MNKIYVAYWGYDNEEMISAPTVQDAKRIIAKERMIDSHTYTYLLRVRLFAKGDRVYSPEDGKSIIIDQGVKSVETPEPDGILHWEKTCAFIKQTQCFTWGY
jgi:hypothetical protein